MQEASLHVITTYGLAAYPKGVTAPLSNIPSKEATAGRQLPCNHISRRGCVVAAACTRCLADTVQRHGQSLQGPARPHRTILRNTEDTSSFRTNRQLLASMYLAPSCGPQLPWPCGHRGRHCVIRNDAVHCPSTCRRVTVSRIKGDTSNFHTNCQLLASVYSVPCCRPQLLRDHRMGHPVATPSLILLQSSPCWCRLHTTVRAALLLCGHTHH